MSCSKPEVSVITPREACTAKPTYSIEFHAEWLIAVMIAAGVALGAAAAVDLIHSRRFPSEPPYNSMLVR